MLCFLPPFSFDMSLTCSRDLEKEEPPPYDVALKLTARFSDRQFLRSARVSGNWVGEEASTSYFPFIPDQPFRVNILFWCSWPIYMTDDCGAKWTPEGVFVDIGYEDAFDFVFVSSFFQVPSTAKSKQYLERKFWIIQ